jgi:hypothetical protein
LSLENTSLNSTLTIDGAMGEGGGQILRTALSLPLSAASDSYPEYPFTAPQSWHAAPASCGGGGSESYRYGRGQWCHPRLAAEFRGTPLKFALWDGSEYGEGSGEEGICVHIGDRSALYRFVYNPEVQFGDLYTLGRIDVKGDLVRAVESAYAALDQPPGRWYWLRRVVQLIRKGPSTHIYLRASIRTRLN